MNLWTDPWTRNVAILCMRDLDQFEQGKPIDPIRTGILHRLQETAPHPTLSSGSHVAKFAYEQCAKTFYRLLDPK